MGPEQPKTPAGPVAADAPLEATDLEVSEHEATDDAAALDAALDNPPPRKGRRTRAESWPKFLAKYAIRGTKQALIVEGSVWLILCIIGTYTMIKADLPWWWAVGLVTVLSGTNALRVVFEGKRDQE